MDCTESFMICIYVATLDNWIPAQTLLHYIYHGNCISISFTAVVSGLLYSWGLEEFQEMNVSLHSLEMYCKLQLAKPFNVLNCVLHINTIHDRNQHPS